MKQYKGYYIDGASFNSKADIDAFIKNQAVERYNKLNKIFSNSPSIEAAHFCNEQARVLHDCFDFSYDEIEALEIAAIA